jgi:hypothetical protein
MLDDAIGYVTGSDDLFSTAVIGGVLLALSVFVLPALVLQGYFLRVIREASEGAEAIPSFTDWGGLAVDGLKLLAVNLVYGVVVGVPLLAAVPVLIPDPTAPTDAALYSLFGLTLGAGFLLNFLLPAAYANLALTGSVVGAFHLKTVLAIAFTAEYLVPWLLSLFVLVVGTLVGGTLVLVAVGLPILFLVFVLVNYLWGRGVGAATSGRRGATA